ncbi:MAG: hypothetical protein Q8P54_02625 [bacterium]|nr:hypothetical protein [bacterium]
MAKKKKKKKFKKQAFIYKKASTKNNTTTQIDTIAKETPVEKIKEAGESSPKEEPQKVEVGQNYAYVKTDLVKTLIYASIIIAVLLVVWWLFSHTFLGAKIYSLIRF